jgi:hypothetical protein
MCDLCFPMHQHHGTWLDQTTWRHLAVASRTNHQRICKDISKTYSSTYMCLLSSSATLAYNFLRHNCFCLASGTLQRPKAPPRQSHDHPPIRSSHQHGPVLLFNSYTPTSKEWSKLRDVGGSVLKTYYSQLIWVERMTFRGILQQIKI